MRYGEQARGWRMQVRTRDIDVNAKNLAIHYMTESDWLRIDDAGVLH